MSALAPIAPIEPRMMPIETAALPTSTQPTQGLSTQNLQVQPTQIDAFRSVLASAGQVLSSNPEAIGRALLSGLNNFSASEQQSRVHVQQAIDPSDTSTESPGSTPLSDGAEKASAPLSTADMLHKGEAIQQRSMGMMMQTYSFALEATLVSNAATTFTSSINTLIKTQ